jgi:antitoxin YefM
MEALHDKELQRDIAGALDRVNEDHTPIIITREDGKPGVLLSLEDFNAYEETAYLLRSPANAERLMKALADVEKGRVERRDLVEDD